MGLFDLFKSNKVAEPVFYSDSNSVTSKEIDSWIKEIKQNPTILPPDLPSDYTAKLVDKLKRENRIHINGDSVENGVRTVLLAISRSAEGDDNMVLQYALYNPNVIYITTAPYTFVGSSTSFNLYSQALMREYPYVQLGADSLRMNTVLGTEDKDAYAVRSLFPLLGGKDEYDYFLEAVKCIPIWGYDLRDGYHRNEHQNYIDPQYGINMQLAKLYQVNNRSVPGVITAGEALFGSRIFDTQFTSGSASDSNAILANATLESTDSDKTIVRLNDIADGKLKITLFTNAPYLWELSIVRPHRVSCKEELDNLMDSLGKLNFPPLENHTSFGLHRDFINRLEGNTAYVTSSLTCCIPNQINSKLIAWEIAEFLKDHKI